MLEKKNVRMGLTINWNFDSGEKSLKSDAIAVGTTPRHST
jgi:hypothetical protein